MTSDHTVQRCRHSEPTLVQPWPRWTAAWQIPWTCHPDGNPALIPDARVCATCGRWAPAPERDQPPKAGVLPEYD